MLCRKRNQYRYVGNQYAAMSSSTMQRYDRSSQSVIDDPAEVLVCADPLVGEAVRYIADRRREALQVDDVAEHVNVSRSTLIRRIKAEMGRSVLSEIDRQRVDELKWMLMETGCSIAEIGELCGFSGPSVLSRYFKQRVGVTPSAYRRGQRVPERALVYWGPKGVGYH